MAWSKKGRVEGGPTPLTPNEVNHHNGTQDEKHQLVRVHGCL